MNNPSTASQSHASELLLNGFHLSLSADAFPARRMALQNNKSLKELRVQHPDWFIYWRDGFLYAIPRISEPTTHLGDTVTLSCAEHLQFIVALIDGLLPKKFPGYDAFRRHPFAFAGKKDELIAAAATKLRSKPALLKSFTIRPTFILEAKIIETVPDQTALGLFLTINTRWECTADLPALQAAGADLGGLYVVRRKTLPGERRLIGQIKSIVGSTVNLSAAYDDRTDIYARSPSENQKGAVYGFRF